jgi:hypothetical protein
MRKIYISGPISGLSIEDAIENFQEAERLFEMLNFKVFNPIKISPFHASKTWADYMKDDLAVLLDFTHKDCIYMLRGYERSKGAMIELQIATAIGLAIIYQGSVCN